MKKLLVLALILGLTLAFTACGGTKEGSAAAALSAQKAGSISIDLPADMKPVEAASGYAFKGEGSTVTISEPQEVAESPADITEETFAQNAENNGMSNVTIANFTNDKALGSGKAAMATIGGNTAGGNAVTIVMIYYFPADNQMIVINFLYGTGAGTALEKNVQAVIDSIA